MARRKSKKSKFTRMIVALTVIALSILTVCTLFMPVFTASASVGGLISADSDITGQDVVSAALHSEVSTDLSGGANALILLRNSDDNGLVTTVFVYAYLGTLIAAAASLVCALLSLLGIRIRLLLSVLGAALLLLAIVTFVFALIVSGRFGSVSSVIFSGKTSISIGIYLMIAALVGGITEVYSSKI